MRAKLYGNRLDAGAMRAVLDDVVAGRYSDRLETLVGVPHIPKGYRSVWAQYSVLTDRRTELMTALKTAGIPTAIYYPKPLHTQTAFSSLGYSVGTLPVSERVSQTVFSLPMHPYLEEKDQRKIVDTLGAC